MLLIIGVAAAAAAAVLAFNHYREHQPQMASQAARRTAQLAAVTLCLARAAEGLVEALSMGLRPAVAAFRPDYRAERLVDMDWED